MSRLAQRSLAVLVLTLWMSPTLGAIGVGAHVALEHQHADGHHDAQGHMHHDCGVFELARAAAHGHHHEAETAPEHDHESRVDGSPPTLRPSSQSAALLPAPASCEPVSADSMLTAGALRRGPPLALFTAHCSLLL